MWVNFLGVWRSRAIFVLVKVSQNPLLSSLLLSQEERQDERERGRIRGGKGRRRLEDVGAIELELEPRKKRFQTVYLGARVAKSESDRESELEQQGAVLERNQTGPMHNETKLGLPNV